MTSTVIYKGNLRTELTHLQVPQKATDYGSLLIVHKFSQILQIFSLLKTVLALLIQQATKSTKHLLVLNWVMLIMIGIL